MVQLLMFLTNVVSTREADLACKLHFYSLLAENDYFLSAWGGEPKLSISLCENYMHSKLHYQ